MNEREIFVGALRVDSNAERTAFLDNACADDAALRARIESLLGEHDRLGSFMQAPAPAVMAAIASPDRTRDSNADLSLEASHLVNQALGDFRIVREIGRGGMGLVYEAQQLSLGRRVALKVLPLAAILDKTQLARFKNEARAAASLEHPNVVPVYSVGNERGVHYYAMQLIEGPTVADLIRRQREDLGVQPVETRAGSPSDAGQDSGTARAQHAPGSTGDELTAEFSSDAIDQALEGTNPKADAGFSTHGSGSPRDRLRRAAQLAAQAADALEHAHQMGIVHRDVKPSNLMIDAEGQLRITDFGLAMIEAEHDLTSTGAMIGTLRYMSPEQMRGDRRVLDHRTDVYSLGVTLYEMLTLQPAFGGNDVATLTESVPNTNPPKPRHLISAIPRDLETIVMKSIAKEPKERYTSAAEMANDLRRFLEDEPIQAKPPGPIERARKWAKRHRSLVATACVTLAIAVLVAGGLLWYEQNQTLAAYDAEKEQHRLAIQNEAKALEAERKAEARFQLARRAVDEMYTQFAEEWLAQQGALNEVQREFLEKALAFYEEFSSEDQSDPDLQFEALRALERVAVIQEKFGQYVLAEASFLSLIEEGGKFVKEYPTPTRVPPGAHKCSYTAIKCVSPVGQDRGIRSAGRVGPWRLAAVGCGGRSRHRASPVDGGDAGLALCRTNGGGKYSRGGDDGSALHGRLAITRERGSRFLEEPCRIGPGLLPSWSADDVVGWKKSGGRGGPSRGRQASGKAAGGASW